MLSSKFTSIVLPRAQYTQMMRGAPRRFEKADGSRGSKVAEIQKRLAEFERNARASTSQVSNEYAVESMMAEKQIQTDESFERVVERRKIEHENNRKIRADVASSQHQVSFPYAQNTEIKYENRMGKNDVANASSSADRGFYINGDLYFDEYQAGTSLDLPEDRMTRAFDVYGAEDAVENIEFQLPGQLAGKEEEGGLEETSLDSTEQFGTVDPDQPVSKHNCGGCGANFHCKDSSLPGFVPLEVLEKVDRNKKAAESQLCKRCHLLKHHNFLLNVNVCPVDYKSMMSHLKMKEEALILLIVDVTDIPGSIHRQLPNIIGSKKPMIVVANKVDLLPPDARGGYLKRFKMVVEEAIRDAGFADQFNILHTALVSAKTGYGVEDLITEIHMKWTNARMSMRADLYLVGCTNAGKSTLFNAFLQSDLCKVRAVDLIERATTSLWPGTTISLLKFPVMKLTPHRLELRRRRLLSNSAWQQRENYTKKLALQQTGNDKYAVLTGTIQNTYKEQEDEAQPVRLREIFGEDTPEKEHEKRWSLDDPIFTKGNWCYDTPGTVNVDQLLNIFTLSELVTVLPRKLIRPRTAILSPGRSLIIGGVGVVDIVGTDNNEQLLLTVFASDALPLNVIHTTEVSSFLERQLAQGTLVVPHPDPKRLEKWPKMRGETFELDGKAEGATADLVLSSIGWVTVTSPNASIIHCRVPTGKGIAVRQPMLPYSASLRGRRLPGTAFYAVKPVSFPVNFRRLSATKNRSRHNSGSRRDDPTDRF
ncbi:unnamed protein product, partial [Mesorhabditis spiculigera]